MGKIGLIWSNLPLSYADFISKQHPVITAQLALGLTRGWCGGCVGV